MNIQIWELKKKYLKKEWWWCLYVCVRMQILKGYVHLKGVYHE